MYILVDFNYIFYRILFAKTTGSAYPVNDMDKQELKRDILSSILSTIIQYPDLKGLIFCADGGTSWRTSIEGNENYKANRSDRHSKVDMESAMYVFSDILNVLKNSGIPVLKASTIEGDDWCCCLSHLFYKQGISSLILSGDKDLFQLLRAEDDFSKYVVMYNQFDQMHYIPKPIPVAAVDIFSLDKIGNLSVFSMAHTVIDPEKISFIKILSGDKSDNVPSAYTYTTKSGKSTFGFTEKRVERLLEEKRNFLSLSKIVENHIDRISLAKSMIETVSTKDDPSDIEVLSEINQGLERNIKACYLSPSVYPLHIKTTILNVIKQVLSSSVKNKSYTSILTALIGEYSTGNVYYKDV